MLQNLASSLFLTERDDLFYEGLTQPDGRVVNKPQTKGRVVTTLHKAKEVRPLIEKCITIARKSLKHEDAADEFATDAERNTDAWRQWRQSEKWQRWNAAIAPAVAARRRCLQLLGNKEAVQILFDDIAPRFEERDGGYTRVVRLASPRLGDGGPRAIIELVGKHDRVAESAEMPAFDDEQAEGETDDVETAEDENEDLEASAEKESDEEPPAEDDKEEKES